MPFLFNPETPRRNTAVKTNLESTLIGVAAGIVTTHIADPESAAYLAPMMQSTAATAYHGIQSMLRDTAHTTAKKAEVIGKTYLIGAPLAVVTQTTKGVLMHAMLGEGMGKQAANILTDILIKPASVYLTARLVYASKDYETNTEPSRISESIEHEYLSERTMDSYEREFGA